jgi:hypothetical protein
MSVVYDMTNNYSQDGEIWFAYNASAATVMFPTTINGFSAYYNRMTIVTKGTGTPKCSRIQRPGGCTGGTLWNIYEQYSFNPTVTDATGTPIQSATVVISYNGTVLYTLTTDVNGNITVPYLTFRRWYFDPINEPTFPNIAETTTDVHDLKITKSGYETYTCKVSMSKKQDLLVELKKAIPVMISSNGIPVIKLDSTNSNINRGMCL